MDGSAPLDRAEVLLFWLHTSLTALPKAQQFAILITWGGQSDGQPQDWVRNINMPRSVLFLRWLLAGWRRNRLLSVPRPGLGLGPIRTSPLLIV
ncbi:hypothetical protein V2G26_008261 [Clonostachys chloroleuca]